MINRDSWGLPCYDCIPGWVHSGVNGTCEECEHDKSYDLQGADSHLVWLGVLFGCLVLVCGLWGVDWLSRSDAYERATGVQDKGLLGFMWDYKLFLLYVFVVALLTVLSIFGASGESERSKQWAMMIVIIGAELPIFYKTGKSLLANEGLDKLKVAVGFVQVLVQTRVTFQLEFPLTFSWLVDLMGAIANLDFVQKLSALFRYSWVGCVEGYTFYERWLGAALSPVLLPFLVILFVYIRVKMLGRQASSEVRHQYINSGIRVFFFALFLVFPGIVRTAIDAHLCRQLDGTLRVLMADPSVSCEDSR